MGLSLFQSLAIGGGRTADIMRASDVKTNKIYNDAFNKFVDDNAGPIKKASAKRNLLENRMKKDIAQIVNTYVKGNPNLSDANIYEVANVIYASHGYNLENVTKDVTARKRNHLMTNLTETEKDNTFNYVDAYITNPKDLKSERTLDQIAKKNAQQLVPQVTLDLEAKSKALGRYKETAFFSPDTTKIESDLLAATGYKEDEVIEEGPSAQFKGPVSDEMEMQRFRNLLETRKSNKLSTEKIKQDLEKGDFDTNDIYKFHKGIREEYILQSGIKSGIGNDNYLTPLEKGTKVDAVRLKAFQNLVQRINTAKRPAGFDKYIDRNQVRADLASIAKSINENIGKPNPQTEKADYAPMQIGMIYRRADLYDGTETQDFHNKFKVQKNQKFIYLGDSVKPIILDEYK